MRVPLDRPLAQWIKELESDGKLYVFYKTPEWRALRNKVLEEFHHECSRCLERGKLSRAVTVHHDQEVRERPELALSEFYEGPDGNLKRNLFPLCHRCHDEVHGRAFNGTPPKPQLNIERW